jgi:hypothetical protein
MEALLLQDASSFQRHPFFFKARRCSFNIRQRPEVAVAAQLSLSLSHLPVCGGAWWRWRQCDGDGCGVVGKRLHAVAAAAAAGWWWWWTGGGRAVVVPPATGGLIFFCHCKMFVVRHVRRTMIF